ncbi:MAG: DPP IV N-terminal domain-containing protein, partial [Planctomycetaceae bacterium]|nr:DPP IV N-terminal domain-containing protein [Planctomycetaceae bacterium]
MRSVFLLSFIISLQLQSELPAQAPRVYRDRVTPVWLSGNSQFWYRIDLSEGRREFWLVDAEAGTRLPAFDHAQVATQLAKITGMEIAADALPVESLDFRKDKTVLLKGTTAQWVLDRESGSLNPVSAEQSPDSAIQLFLPPRPSQNGGTDVDLEISNALEEPIQVIWISTDGERRSYGTIQPGQTHSQHTYAGHVWLVTSSNGTELGCFEAAPRTAHIVIDQNSVDHVTTRRSRQDRRGASRADRSNSPDGNHHVFVRDHNLWIRPTGPDEKNAAALSDDRAQQLTSDASAEMTFHQSRSRARMMGLRYDMDDAPEDRPDVVWSPNSRFLLAWQTREVPEQFVHYVDSTPREQLQPELRSYPYLKPGASLPDSAPRLFRISDGTEIGIDHSLFPEPWSLEFLRWSADGTKFWLEYNERGHQRLSVLEVNAETGAVRRVVDETSETFIHYSTAGKHELHWLPNEQLLWASERSGWNHLYRYDLNSAAVINAVTTGNWNVRRIEHIDQENQQIWFFAVGILPDQDPYHEHFCRIRFDGSRLLVLTEGDGTHQITWSPDRRYFLDQYSRVDLPPVTELRRAEDGHLCCVLETADASEVLQQRGSLPERFVAKGRDGMTDIWGIIHRPRNFDPTQNYPVVENIYAGPHDHHVPKAFRTSYRHQHQIADAGFIVVQIDGMGTAWRSKEFHDVCFRNLRDAGFPDRIAWIKAAGAKYPWMDLDRVGIYGGSAGGQNAMAALLWHSDFYDAAVADCGCHDNRMDKIWWNEQWMGYPVGDWYVTNSNRENAALLKGQLMLIVGELDRNVDPATTFQVARKLIEAGKEFEFVVIPGAGHGAAETPWGSAKRLHFLVESLSAGS